MAADNQRPLPPESPKTRPLVLRRDNWGQVALHDAETGEMLAGQAEVTVRQLPSECTEVTVRFHAQGGQGVKIQVDDGD